ncbi:MAG: hypothetical protein PUD95_08420 [Succinatimonas sp.]|nr:hypothetical protein [Succinatimonas sp.]
MYEAHHNTTDTVLLQDMQHCCDENHLASVINLNSMFYNVISFARERYPNKGMTILNTVLRKLQGKLLLSPTRLALKYLRTILC